ncbi:MAG: polysaccharide deacetylase family protein [Candidatus Thiodiazotropha sp. (ex Lucinoma borealis)]|nr:polysaccharide deacetylase family protein [Candidatus Thiodiazotropha sp. (ex Lucinoma borealis)]MCU7869188.1 polysaccharide deacetylase family protein [Candidatus Thiodiazotropha sp. (ex Lucinoma borealis)]
MRKALSVLKKSIKVSFAYTLYYTGFSKYYLLKRLSNKAIVLTYHRILPREKRNESFSHEAIMVDPFHFDMQLKALKECFRIVDIIEFNDLVRSGIPDGPPVCLITFDDGWVDNYNYALPILKRHQCPAIIFVPTYYISSALTFWQETLGYQIAKICEIGTSDAKKLMAKHGLPDIESGSDINRNIMIKDYVRSLKSLSYNKIDKIMTELTKFHGMIGVSKVDRHLSWDELRELYKSGVAIGSHACTHRILTRLTQDVVESELVESKNTLEDNLGKGIDTIAYPNGDYNNQLGELTKKAGYSLGFGTNYGYVSGTDDLFDIKRINMNDTTASSKPVLLATILGIM